MIQDILNGNVTKFNTLMLKYEKMVYAVANRKFETNEEKEDFVQDVFLQVYQSLSSFRGDAQFSTWLYQIARNLASKKQNQNQSKDQIQVDDHSIFDNLKLSASETFRKLSNHASIEGQVIKEEIASTIRRLVDSLPARYKNPIHMYYFQNYSYKEIAEKLNLKTNTLKSYIFRGREILREMWSHEKD
ncbi:RNA polymerase sigma factor [Leptospira sp. GIMC2001]|uniref:RNA polymerase sigma factor n=1 Tax=Leptospira sp. GIMC2001 TaxID=1513297 RepID=UPI002349A08A|nr:sigma-70 family RNA polymerase sigma factor [Leptospira sp. GIMC2001]WCL48957.1 sigma-70 family RNA polymerase sigma factor [Leptospira sp. GIMC2001]